MISRAAISAMSIGSATAGISRASIAAISITGTWRSIDRGRRRGSIICACTRLYIDCRWRSYIDCGRWCNDHATRTCKKPRAGGQ
jgi:hypothetical protein